MSIRLCSSGGELSCGTATKATTRTTAWPRSIAGRGSTRHAGRARREVVRSSRVRGRSALVGVFGVVNLDKPGHYVHWWVIQLSVANLVVIGLMVSRLSVQGHRCPVPKGARSRAGRRRTVVTDSPSEAPMAGAALESWSAAVRRGERSARCRRRSCCRTQPVYVASWIYVFGVLTVAALVVVAASGGCWR